MSAATWKFTFPLSVKSKHAVPLVRSAQANRISQGTTATKADSGSISKRAEPSAPPGPHDTVLAVGGRTGDHARSFAEVAIVGRTPEIRFGIPDESNIPFYVLRRPTRPLAEAFQGAKRFQ
jgi:hypothetical protein